MKKLLTILGVVGLLGLLTTAAMAATDAEYVTVTVNETDLLSVPENTIIALTVTDPGATAYTQGTKTDTGGLKYSHNATGNKKITAAAVADERNAANDITLTVAVAGGAGAQMLVNAGADVTAGAVVWTGIAAGGYTKNLTWTADGTLADTLHGNYGWSVTFTSADAS